MTQEQNAMQARLDEAVTAQQAARTEVIAFQHRFDSMRAVQTEHESKLLRRDGMEELFRFLCVFWYVSFHPRRSF